MFWNKKRWPAVAHEEIVKRARLLVIDDGEFPYLKLFRRDGYTVEKWNKVKDLGALEHGGYDLILLDLHGVGIGEAAEQGLGVLAHIRKVSPAQSVVAYSNAEWSVEYQEFFRSADAVLHKSKDDYMSFKRTVDALLDERFSLGFYVDRITSELEGATLPESLPRKIEKAILSRDPQALGRFVGKFVDDPVTVDRVIAIAGVAVGVIQIWTS